MKEIQTIIELSHEFGTKDYVKGGGGNVSVKNETTLWVKPSGTTLAELTEDSLLEMNRTKIDKLYSVKKPSEAVEREELVKNMMADAVVSDSGRPSVEAPLHNVFGATYVVHTHPALLNGLTCAKNGATACQRLFPDALWVEYIDPGYTLCMEVRKRIENFKATNGCEPALLILQNHGIFAAADTANEIRELYNRVMSTLSTKYKKTDISTVLTISESEDSTVTTDAIQSLFGDDANFISSCEMFGYAPGPITPDHLVYSKAFPFTDELTIEKAQAYKKKRGYVPKIVIAEDNVYGIGVSQKNADLALELAQDGALVKQFSEAFGGIQYMTDSQRKFIENWEVEAYRQKQM